MSNLSGQVYGDICCSFNADASPAFFLNRGFSSTIVRTGVGDYTLALADGAGVNLQTGACVRSAIQGATPGMISVEPLTVTTMRVRTLNAAGAAADLDFWLDIQQITAT